MTYPAQEDMTEEITHVRCTPTMKRQLIEAAQLTMVTQAIFVRQAVQEKVDRVNEAKRYDSRLDS